MDTDKIPRCEWWYLDFRGKFQQQKHADVLQDNNLIRLLPK